MNNFLAPMAVRLAQQGEHDRKELAERMERERIEREAAQARDQSREQVAAERAQVFQATAVAAIAKVDYGTQVAATRHEAEKAERVEEIKQLGRVIAEELKPTFEAQTLAIENLVKAISARKEA